ncbi:hypothetical protein BCV71DRAFT_268794 [Rhizopus microsporus]|uniref:SprT-like domain-containing protein n=2 Tax=Rhizopus TaxID=4842 RepID=A0A1X0RLS4_RHIZD|nr:hypothetical protein BCV71DRAFT_268794 [Rhizopus microsporus]
MASNKEEEQRIELPLLNEIKDTSIDNLFMVFNNLYFSNQLVDVKVEWSKRMTRSTGNCTGTSNNSCTICLSEPLLKLRPKKDLIETLLTWHEMIHALHFITQVRNGYDEHGPAFHRETKHISRLAKLNITVSHYFNNEVKCYQTHVWQCDGPCQMKSPYFGIIRRSINRPPQPAGAWYSEHQRACGGNFIKIAEPDKKQTKVKRGPLDD